MAASDRRFGVGVEQNAQALELTVEALKIKQLDPIIIRQRVKMLLDETNTFYLYRDQYNQI